MAHKKAGGSSRNGRDSHAQRLGVKRFAGEQVSGGTILVRNAELSGNPAGGVPQTYLGNPVPTYDPAHYGGTTTLNIDAATTWLQKVTDREYLSR